MTMAIPIIKSARYPGGERRLEELRGTQDFRLADVVVDLTFLAGKTTNGSAGWGLVQRIMPGIGFAVDNGIQQSVLWSQFWRLDPTVVMLQQAMRPLSAVRRTDSGMDYGWPGYPDCAWWEEQGVMDPLFVAAPTLQVERLLLQELLTDADDGTLEEEGPFRRAWNRQKAQRPAETDAGASRAPQCVLGAFHAALAAPDAEGAPPAELGGSDPARRAGERCSAYTGPVASLMGLLPVHLRPAPLVVSAEVYRGRGIVGFREPDQEGKTQREFRAALLPAIRTWLTKELPRQAKQAALDWDIDGPAGAVDIAWGGWPAGRLYKLTAKKEGGRLSPLDYYACALWAADVCEKFLTSQPLCPLELEATAFLQVDKLEGGRTLMDLWNWSRFGPLAAAPPLSDEDDLVDPAAVNPMQCEYTEAAEEEEEATDVDLGYVLAKSYTVSLPGWLWAAFVGWLLTYMWMVGYLVALPVRRF